MSREKLHVITWNTLELIAAWYIVWDLQAGPYITAMIATGSSSQTCPKSLNSLPSNHTSSTIHYVYFSLICQRRDAHFFVHLWIYWKYIQYKGHSYKDLKTSVLWWTCRKKETLKGPLQTITTVTSSVILIKYQVMFYDKAWWV